MATLSLNGEWKLSSGKIETSAKIPGDFHSALLENKIIENPYEGFNEKDILWVGQSDWTIERDFDFEFEPGTRQILEITEADTFFTLFINGKKCGFGQNAFLRYRFDITKYLIDGKNHIKIIFESAEKKSNEIAKKLPYVVPYMKYDLYSPNRNLARKCQCHGGWDWGPCLMVSGIYGEIKIESVETGLFDSVQINYSHKENLWTAKITANFTSFKNAEKEFCFKISGAQDSLELAQITKKVKLSVGKNVITANLNVENPWIWKTAGELKEEGLSENLLYNLTVEEVGTSTVPAQKITKNPAKISQKFSFSSLKTITKKDKALGKDGRCLYFENNGRMIFAKGSNWVPADAFPSRMTVARYQDLLQSAVDANQNCLRVWGGGYYEKEIFYELCDRLGIIVWQDCMFACSLYPVTQEFLDNVSQEIEYQVNRLQSHACIGLWCGNNENFGTLNWFEPSIKNRDRYLVDYDRLYNDTIGKKIRQIDPSRIFWPSSPCAGPDDFADNWHADNMGDMHYWSVWHERKSFDAYLSIKPRFVSEFGYESFPSLETIRSFAKEKDWNFTSKLMEYHQRSPSGNSIILENFSRYFQFPNGFENMLYLSQVQQALAIKTAVDWWRSLKPHCMGALIWQLNDVWPCPSWSSLEYNGKWKLLHYESKKFFDIVYMPLFIKDGKLYANICNDTKDDLELSLEISYLKFDGSDFKKSQKIQKNILPDSTENIFEENIDDDLKSDYFIFAQMTAKTKSGKIYTCENTLFPDLYKHSNMEKAEISSQVSQVDDYFEIKLSTDKPAFYLSLDNDDLPGRFSDNMFTLLPNKAKTVIFRPKANENAGKVSLEQVKKSLKIKDLRATY